MGPGIASWSSAQHACMLYVISLYMHAFILHTHLPFPLLNSNVMTQNLGLKVNCQVSTQRLIWSGYGSLLEGNHSGLVSKRDVYSVWYFFVRTECKLSPFIVQGSWGVQSSGLGRMENHWNSPKSGRILRSTQALPVF